jgi:hypothetical protein
VDIDNDGLPLRYEGSSTPGGQPWWPYPDRRAGQSSSDPLDLTQLEIYSDGKPQGVARLVDAVVNGMQRSRLKPTQPRRRAC